MLARADWLEAAQRLQEGRSTRITHWCGPGKPLLITHKAHQWDCYCHRCGEGGVEEKRLTLAERIERRAQVQAADDAIKHQVALPMPANFDVETWPTEALLWLAKASIARPEIEELGCYYHDPSGRVVLPVVDGEAITYWQARSVDGREPKYINPKVDRQHLVAKFGEGETLVLTEDVLSAYRIGQVTEAWSLMGTKLTDRIASDILRRGGKVLVWLDPDWQHSEGHRPGVKAGIAITKQLHAMGITARRVISRADPKLLSRREILWHLQPSSSQSSSSTYAAKQTKQPGRQTSSRSR